MDIIFQHLKIMTHCFSLVPGRNAGKKIGTDLLPSIIANAYYYRFKIRSKGELQSSIKRKQEAGVSGIGDQKKKREGKQTQVLCHRL
jgi:hypothetical protein